MGLGWGRLRRYAMIDSEIHRLLQKVRAEMDKARNPDPDDDGRDLLRRLGKDINELLEQTRGVTLQPWQSMLRGLEQAVEHFEVTSSTFYRL